MLLKYISQPSNSNLEDGIKPHFRIWAIIRNLIYALFWLEAGYLLLGLPWSSYWENNYVLYLFPQIHSLVANPFFKGAIVGLGIDNILIGIHQIARTKSISRKSSSQ